MTENDNLFVVCMSLIYENGGCQTSILEHLNNEKISTSNRLKALQTVTKLHLKSYQENESFKNSSEINPSQFQFQLLGIAKCLANQVVQEMTISNNISTKLTAEEEEIIWERMQGESELIRRAVQKHKETVSMATEIKEEIKANKNKREEEIVKDIENLAKEIFERMGKRRF